MCAEEHGGEIWDAIKSALDAAIEVGGGVPDTISDIIDSFTEVGESLLDFLDNLIGGGDEADTSGDMVGGKIPVDEYNDIRGSSVKNPDSDTLTLGSYGDGGADSYTARAGETSYFDMGADWNRVQDKYDLSDDEMFKYFNLPILDEATKGGKTIRFSHNPIGDKGFLGMEWEYIKSSLGISDVDLVFEGGFWYVK